MLTKFKPIYYNIFLKKIFIQTIHITELTECKRDTQERTFFFLQYLLILRN